jgi:hypothetical protein
MNGGYVRHALFTAFRVARFDVGASEAFDHSFEGFFRSFFAALLSLPLYVFLVVVEQRFIDDDRGSRAGQALANASPFGAGYWLIEMLAYAVGWAALPLAMILIVKLIGASHRYVPFVIAYNWGSCLVYLAMTIPSIAFLLGIATPTGIFILSYGVAVFVLTYRWRLARETLQISGLNAAGIVIFDALLTFLITIGAARLHRLVA